MTTEPRGHHASPNKTPLRSKCIAEAPQCVPRVGLTVPAMDIPDLDTLKNCGRLSGGYCDCQFTVVNEHDTANLQINGHGDDRVNVLRPDELLRPLGRACALVPAIQCQPPGRRPTAERARVLDDRASETAPRATGRSVRCTERLLRRMPARRPESHPGTNQTAGVQKRTLRHRLGTSIHSQN